jgi:lysophospholipase
METLSIHSDDGTPLRLLRWGDGDKDILLVHGLAEHGGRYTHVAEALVAQGWRVTLVELRGHGESGGKRGHVKVWHHYVEDVQAAAATIGKPFVMVAHSMGGLVALSSLMEPMSPNCKALALSNPLLGVAVDAPAIKVMAAGLLSKLMPTLSLDNELDTAFISRDAAVVHRYDADPMVYGTITPRWYTEMNTARELVNGHVGRIEIPLLMMISTGDLICDHEVARRYAHQWGGEAEVEEYAGLYHEIFNEPEQDQVLNRLTTWLETVPHG